MAQDTKQLDIIFTNCKNIIKKDEKKFNKLMVYTGIFVNLNNELMGLKPSEGSSQQGTSIENIIKNFFKDIFKEKKHYENRLTQHQLTESDFVYEKSGLIKPINCKSSIVISNSSSIKIYDYSRTTLRNKKKKTKENILKEVEERLSESDINIFWYFSNKKTRKTVISLFSINELREKFGNDCIKIYSSSHVIISFNVNKIEKFFPDRTISIEPTKDEVQDCINVLKQELYQESPSSFLNRVLLKYHIW